MNILRSKTMVFAILLAVLSAAQASLSMFALTPQQTGIAGLVLAVAVAVLRILTTQPLSEK